MEIIARSYNYIVCSPPLQYKRVLYGPSLIARVIFVLCEYLWVEQRSNLMVSP